MKIIQPFTTRDGIDRKKAGVVKEEPWPNPEIIVCYLKKKNCTCKERTVFYVSLICVALN